MESCTVCLAGAGLIVPLEDGQTMDGFDVEQFMRDLLMRRDITERTMGASYHPPTI
jgi:hypothetical protein